MLLPFWKAFAMASQPFQFFAPLSFFEKASAPEGERRRIAGVISTETLDKQGEIVIQKGLNFAPFLKTGFFNDNHSKKTADVLGAPDSVTKFRKGERLPDGEIAAHNCTWAEGHLFDTPDARKVWDLGMGMKKSGSGRRLGFSIEGQIVKRQGPQNKVVAEANVNHVAVTNCPVGEGTRLETLAKALTMGTSSAHPSTMGPVTGAGAGRVLAPQGLEQDGVKRVVLSTGEEDEDEDDEGLEKSIAVHRIKTNLGCSQTFAERTYETLVTLKEQGLLGKKEPG